MPPFVNFKPGDHIWFDLDPWQILSIMMFVLYCSEPILISNSSKKYSSLFHICGNSLQT